MNFTPLDEDTDKRQRNDRVAERYDELRHIDRHGHYETLFQVVREEIERERERCAKLIGNQ